MQMKHMRISFVFMKFIARLDLVKNTDIIKILGGKLKEVTYKRSFNKSLSFTYLFFHV